MTKPKEKMKISDLEEMKEEFKNKFKSTSVRYRDQLLKIEEDDYSKIADIDDIWSWFSSRLSQKKEEAKKIRKHFWLPARVVTTPSSKTSTWVVEFVYCAYCLKIRETNTLR